ncbi:hypothetical protein [Bacillus siamensis]|uniref:hypothetical protein n=1 Tax=Bacillus siamensis TaxID=659243 RepID=UPI002E1EC304|nr:hypothetical protein [Bacillus siamensis]MED0777953.1 hypothetical protein [Bacillus siamensis]MED0781882.1 hypothetical protein [Bacillus siamensis]MED0836463.1 hypothetical protein [Bacillus siamensis]
MQKLSILFKNRMILSINQSFFSNSTKKKLRISGFITLLLFSICIIGLTLITWFLSDVFLQLFLYITKKYTVEEKKILIRLLSFIIFIIFSIDGVQNYISKTLYSKDFKVALYAPIKPGIYLLYRMIEGHLKQIIIWFIVISVFTGIFVMHKMISILQAPLVFLVGCLYVTLIYLTRYFILFNLFKKLAMNQKLTKVYISLFLGYFSLFVAILKVIEYSNRFFSFSFLDFLPKVTNNTVFLAVSSVLTSKYFPINYFMTLHFEIIKGNYIICFLNIVLIFSIFFLFVWYLFREISNSNYLSLLYEVMNKSKEHKILQRISNDNDKKNSFSFLRSERISSIIILKDLKCLLRERKIIWGSYLFSAVFGYGSIYFIYFIVNIQSSIPIPREEIGIFVSIYVMSLTVQSLMDRFGVDSELKNIKIYLSAPINLKDYIKGKFIISFFSTAPLLLLNCLFSWLLFNSNPVLVLFMVIIHTVPFIFIGLIASATFPNYDIESILELPTFKSRILMNILTLCYLMISIGIYSAVNSLMIGASIIVLVAVIVSFILYRFINLKLEKRIHF